MNFASWLERRLTVNNPFSPTGKKREVIITALPNPDLIKNLDEAFKWLKFSNDASAMRHLNKALQYAPETIQTMISNLLDYMSENKKIPKYQEYLGSLDYIIKYIRRD